MNANFFALGQAQVAGAISEKPNLYQGANAGAMKRAARMAMIGTLAAMSFGLAPQEASAQMTPQQFQQDLQRREIQHQQNLERNRQQQEFNRENNRQNARNHREFQKDAFRQQNKQVAAGLLTALGVGVVTAAVVNSANSNQQQRQVYASPQPQRDVYQQRPQQGNFYQQDQQARQQPTFYAPRDLGMPDRFNRVSQRFGIGMAAPGPYQLDLRDGSQTSHNMVRAIDQLKSAVDDNQMAQRQLDDMRLSNYPVGGQQKQQVNGAMASSNNNLDRAIESYIRMSNNAALEGKNTQGFNMLVAKMVNENLAPEQQMNMSVNARPNFGYQR